MSDLKAAEQAGKSMSRVGMYLTLIVTAPIIGCLFGPIGLVLGSSISLCTIIYGVVCLYAAVKYAKKEEVK